jgi:hypothetical protein
MKYLLLVTMLLWSVIAHAQDEQHLLDFEKTD